MGRSTVYADLTRFNHAIAGEYSVYIVFQFSNVARG